jgi:hypothetical protein
MFIRWTVIFSLGLLAGCVDLGKVSLHPQLKQFWFSANMDSTYRCLDGEAMINGLRLEEDDPLPGGSRRFNLEDRDSLVVAWLDMTPFGQSTHKQTSVDLFYGHNDPQTEQQLMAMMTQCKKTLD